MRCVDSSGGTDGFSCELLKDLVKILGYNLLYVDPSY